MFKGQEEEKETGKKTEKKCRVRYDDSQEWESQKPERKLFSYVAMGQLFYC